MGATSRAYIYPTDRDWSAFLRERPQLTEINFWTPSGAGFRSLRRNDRFLFKAKSRDGGRLIGGGLYSHFERATVSIAWRAFGEGNGVGSAEKLLAAVTGYRRKQGLPLVPDPEIGCIILHSAFFTPDGAGIAPPSDYNAGAVRGRGYTPARDGWPEVDAAFSSLAWRSGALQRDPDPDLVSWVGGSTLSEPTLGERRHRLGQGEFRVRVAASYRNRCAITGSKVTLALDAAHIRPVEKEGAHRLDNGLLLRTDVHRLFDAGYLGVDLEHRLRVSKRLRVDFGNGDEFYAREGSDLTVLPTRPGDRPHRDFLEWHNDEVFKSA